MSLFCATILAAGLAGTPGRAAPAPQLAEASRPVAFDVVLPLRNRDALEGFVASLHDPASPSFHKWLTPAQFGMRFGPDTATMDRVAAAFGARGFTVSAQTRSLHVTGTAAQVGQHLGTRLMLARTPEGVTHIQQERAATVPAEIADTGAEVFSFSPHVAHVHSLVAGRIDPDNRYGATGPYWFTDLKQAYRYPSATATAQAFDGTTKPLDGTGVTLGVLMSSDVFDSDIAAVFDHENWTKFSGKPDPVLAGRVYVNGGATTDSPAFAEASLDTQEELTGAPGAAVVLYDIPDLSDGNVFAGYVTIVEANKVDLVSSSFGECEEFYQPRYNGGQSYLGVLKAEHELFLQGNAQGITFLASSGDNAGKECPSPSYLAGGKGAFHAGVSTPASDTAVTAVGGTNVVTSYVQGVLRSTYVGENGWTDPEIPNDPYGTGGTATGGVWGAGSGYSVIFKKPSYQSLVDTGSDTARAVPDIGMMVGGCPGGISKLRHVPGMGRTCNGLDDPKDGNGNTQRSAVVVALQAGQGGGFYGLIGTSVASPELAGATAMLIEQQGRMGNLNTYIYGLAAQQAAKQGRYFHTNIPGYNGLVNTDLNSAFGLTAGVGTPVVVDYIGASGVDAAGNPQTRSNP